MDIFRVLTRGAALNKSKGVSVDYAMPLQFVLETQLKKNKDESLKHEVEKEIDFFHTKKHVLPVTDDEDGTEKEPEVETDEIMTVEEASQFRKLIQANVSGCDAPLPVATFQDLTRRFQLDGKLLTNLINSGFVEPTAVQSEAIPTALENRDLIVCAPTGSGKTVAFLVPLVQRVSEAAKEKNSGIKGLVISPTNELAVQIYHELETLVKGKKMTVGILSKLVAGKINSGNVNFKKYDILVSTPLRLIDCVKTGGVDLSTVQQLVIDEADKLFDQGFVSQTDEILFKCTYPKIRKSIFSATIPSGVEEMAQTIMRDPIRIIIGHKEAASGTIDQKVVFTGNEEGKLLAIRQMIQQGEIKPPIIIFLQSVTRAKALFHELIYDKLNVDVIHSERTPKQRDEVIKRFKNGDIWILITTDVIARGVDFKGVNLVINYDVPQSSQAYVHRIGRTGRGGKAGKAVTFFTKEDSVAIKPILNVMKQSGCAKGYDAWMENIHKLSKKEKKTIKKHEIKRNKISSVPKVVKQEKRRRAEMIEASKRRKHQKLAETPSSAQ